MSSCAAFQAAGATQSGIYALRPQGSRADSEVVSAYCDMQTVPAGQSVMVVSGEIMFGTRSCVMQFGNDDMDSTMMWSDYTGRVERTNSQNAASNDWYTLPRDGTPILPGGYTALSPKPSGVPSYSRPVPFPGAGVAGGMVVWFDPSMIRFESTDGQHAFGYPLSVPTTCRPLSGATANRHIFITDGISSVTMGRRGASTTAAVECLVHIAFEWSASLYTEDMLTITLIEGPYSNRPVNWHNTEQDANGGDLLWTVNGKPAWVRARCRA